MWEFQKKKPPNSGKPKTISFSRNEVSCKTKPIFQDYKLYTSWIEVRSCGRFRQEIETYEETINSTKRNDETKCNRN